MDTSPSKGLSKRARWLIGLGLVAVVGGVIAYGNSAQFLGAFRLPSCTTADTAGRACYSITLASSPVSQTVYSGDTDIESIGFNFNAGTVSDITLTDLTVSGFLNENQDRVFSLGSDNGVSLQDLVSSVGLYDDAGVLLDEESFNASGTATFSGLAVTIPAGSTETLYMRMDIASSVDIPYNGTPDEIALDIVSISTDVVAEDSAGNSVRGARNSSYSNRTNTRPVVVVTVDAEETTAGTITVTSSPDAVPDDKAVAGADSSSDPLLVARYRVYAQEEAFEVDSMTFENDSRADNAMEDNDAISEVILKYPTSESDPETLDGEAAVSLVAGKATFSGLSMRIPESTVDENAVEIELYVVTNEIDSSGIVPSGAQIEMDFNEGEGFEAVGLESGVTVTHNSAADEFGTLADVDANQIALYDSLPTFDQDTSEVVCPAEVLIPATESNVYCLSITADSAGGEVQVYELTFDATPNLLETGTASGQLGAANGWKLYKYSSSGTVDTTAVGQGTWSSSTSQVTIAFDTSSSDSRVSAGSTKYYVLKAPISFTSSADYSMLSVRLAQETTTNHSAPVAAASVSGLNVWSDVSATSHSSATSDWTNSYKLDTLPTDYLILSES